LPGDGDAIAWIRLDSVHPYPAARHQVEVAVGSGVDGDRLASLDRRAEHLRVGVDGQRAVGRVAAREQLEGAVARLLRKRHRAPAWRARGLVRLDPDLEQGRRFVLEIELRVLNAGPGAHHLDVTSPGPALV